MIESFNQAGESKDSDKDTETKKDSKPSVSKKKIGNFTAKNVLEAPNIHRTQKEKSSKPSIWEEILGNDGKPAKPELDPVDRKNFESESAKRGETKTTRLNKDESNQEDTEKALEFLGEEEKQEVVRRIAESRATIIREQGKSDSADQTVDVENAASLILMESVGQKLSENPQAPVEDILDEAEAETVQLLEGEANAKEEQTGETFKSSELPDEERAEEAPMEGEIALTAEEADEAGEGSHTIIIPRSSSGKGTSSAYRSRPLASTSSGGSGTVSGSGGGAGSGGTGGRGGGIIPPRTPGGSSMPPIGGGGGGGGPTGPSGAPAGFNAAPISAVAAPGVSMEDLQRIIHRQERAAIAQGLLIGGIVGYLIGRRRGRIKTEKRLLPVQKKLEAQVEGLQSRVLEREQKIRDIAAEKARDMANEEARTRFARRLAHEDAIRAKAAERQRLGGIETPRMFQLGRVLVEAPAVVLAGTAFARGGESGIEKPKMTTMPARKIEKYSGPELKQAAEKIRIDGTTLKEMWDRGQLSEKSVERVIAEFMEGHSVRAALNRELLDEEALFEIDPKLRDTNQKGQITARSGSGGQSDAAQAGAALLLRKYGENDKGKESDNTIESSTDKTKEAKEPSAFEKASKDPTIQLATAGVIGALLFIAAILIFA